jgi:hypothetical protein
MRLSNSRAKTWRRCPKQYEFKYVRKLERKRKSTALYRGDWLHQLLMVHYDGHDWRERHAELSVKFLNMFEEEREELGDIPAECSRIMRSYLMHYRQDDKALRVVDSELDEVLILPSGDEFNFIIDLVVEEPDGGLWLWDHKTVKNFMPQDFMLMDSQLARYFWAAETMGYTPLRGVMFNELITKPPTLPDVLPSTGRLTERQNLQCDVYSYYREIKAQGQDPKSYAKTLNRLRAQSDRWFRRTPLPKSRQLMKLTMDELMWTAREIEAAVEHGHYPRTTDKSCTWGCDFQDICMIEYMGGDISDLVKLNYQQRGPREGK